MSNNTLHNENGTITGVVSLGSNIETSITNSEINKSASKDSLEYKLNELTQAVSAMIKDLPNDKAQDIKSDLQMLIREAAKDKPRRKWYELSGEGLIEAATALGTLGNPVISATENILKLLN